MITKLIVKNFKKIEDQIFIFNNFDLLVGSNNSGKSTVLQAMAIWQYCVEQFRLSAKKGQRGIQVVLPNFTALPLPEFNLLWKDKTDRNYKPNANDATKKDQIYIYIEIDAYWRTVEGEQNFAILLRYQTPQSLYAIPKDGWVKFNSLEEKHLLPSIVYVPPFSGIEPHESWLDDGNIRQHIGKSQPGSVIRNLLYRVIDIQDERGEDIPIAKNVKWNTLTKQIEQWFGVKLLPPQYKKKVSTEIKVEYESSGKRYDIISAGSGFHQILILLAFYYGYDEVSTILFDEPDAHLHANLQSNILRFFMAQEQKQFIMATHSPEFIANVEVNNILSMLSGVPTKVQSTDVIVRALRDVENMDIIKTQASPYILYVEGDDDVRILSAWANILGKQDIFNMYYTYILHGTSKIDMKNRGQEHFLALKQINKNVRRVQLLDYDAPDTFHPDENNVCIKEWKRKNIDNYLLVPDAWKRAVAKVLREPSDSLLLIPYNDIIDNFFEGQNLTLPKNATWRNVKANVFQVVDGKQLLFENEDSLFHQLRQQNEELIVNRQTIASSMLENEIHEDVINFIDFLKETTMSK